MLLYDVLKMWGIFARPRDEETVLAGAMAELFNNPQPPTGERPEEPEDTPRIVPEAQTRSEKRSAKWVIERCETAFRDWLQSAPSAAEIALITNVFSVSESGGDLAGHLLNHLSIDEDQALGPMLPTETQPTIGGPKHATATA